MLKLKKMRKESNDIPKVETTPNKKTTRNHNRKLTYPVGVVQGTFCQNRLSSPQELSNLLCLCNSYIAFGYSYIQQASEWSSNTINEILFEANNLLQASIDQTLPNLITSNSIIRTFTIQTHLVDIDTSEPEVIGSLASVSTSNASTVYNGLRVFFRRKRRICLFQCQAIYLLIWKEDEIFYVFDSHGRNAECEADRNDGFATLMCLATLQNVTCLIEKLSELKENECYMLTELRLKKIHNRGLIQTEPKQEKFRVLDEHSAVCYGTLTAHDRCFTSTRNLQALTTCCVAYVYSLIHPPNSWTSLVVDKVMLLGNQLYKECTSFVVPEEFSITDLPPHINIGPHSVSVQVAPCQNRGRLYHNLDANPRQSELMREIRLVFVRYDCALLQVETLVFCVWKRDGLFYLFDTYTRRTAVRPGQGDVRDAACLQMHSTLDSLCFVLCEILMKVAEKETFHLHGLSAGIVEATGEWNGTSSFKAKGTLNESVDELFVPKLRCQKMMAGRNKPNNDICNLDSPTVSATQFIRSWQSVKEELNQNDSGEDSDSIIEDEDDDDEDDDDDDDGPESPNNSLGLSNGDYKRLSGLGLTDEEIKSFQRLSLPVSDIIDWNSTKCTPENVERLLALKISCEEYKKLKKQKLTIEDIELMKRLDIPVTKFSKLKNKGLNHEQIMADIMGQANIEEYKKLGLNVKEIRDLQLIGVSPEDYAKCKEMGLTFEEIQYAHKAAIPVADYADMKSKNMSNLDIVKAKEQNLTPEQYMVKKGKEVDGTKKINEDATKQKDIDATKQDVDGTKNIEKDATKNKDDDVTKEKEADAAKEKDVNATKEKEADATKEKEADATKEKKADATKEKDKDDAKEKETDATKEKDVDDAKEKKVDATQEKDVYDANEKQSVPTKEKDADATKKNEINIESQKKDKKEIINVTESKKRPDDLGNDVKNEGTKTIQNEVNTTKNISSEETMPINTIPEALETVPHDLLTTKRENVPQSYANQDHENAMQSHGATQYNKNIPEAIEDNRSLVGAVKHNLGVVKSSTGKATSVLKLLENAFELVDRVLIMNNFGGPDCVVFRSVEEPPEFYLLDSCVCNKELIRRVNVQEIARSDLLKRFKTLNALVDRVVKSSPGPQNAKIELDHQLEGVVQGLSKLLGDLCVLRTKKK